MPLTLTSARPARAAQSTPWLVLLGSAVVLCLLFAASFGIGRLVGPVSVGPGRHGGSTTPGAPGTTPGTPSSPGTGGMPGMSGMTMDGLGEPLPVSSLPVSASVPVSSLPVSSVRVRVAGVAR
jgi:hypothetical protein